MELKDVVNDVYANAAEAHAAFHAGHHDTAKNHLFEIEKMVVEYLRMPATPAGDVTESATSEKAETTSPETPENVPAPAHRQAEPGPVLPASQFGGSLTDVKPTQ